MHVIITYSPYWNHKYFAPIAARGIDNANALPATRSRYAPAGQEHGSGQKLVFFMAAEIGAGAESSAPCIREG